MILPMTWAPSDASHCGRRRVAQPSRLSGAHRSHPGRAHGWALPRAPPKPRLQPSY